MWNGKNVKKFEVMRILRQLSPIQIMTGQKQPENVQYFKYLCSRITNDAISAREDKYHDCHSKRSIQQEKGSLRQ